MFIWTVLLRITHTIISQSIADYSWIILYSMGDNNVVRDRYFWVSCNLLSQGKGKFLPRTGHEGPDGEYRHSSTLPFTSPLDGDGWSTPRPGRFTPGKVTLYPLYRRLCGPQGRYDLLACLCVTHRQALSKYNSTHITRHAATSPVFNIRTSKVLLIKVILARN